MFTDRGVRLPSGIAARVPCAVIKSGRPYLTVIDRMDRIETWNPPFSLQSFLFLEHQIEVTLVGLPSCQVVSSNSAFSDRTRPTNSCSSRRRSDKRRTAEPILPTSRLKSLPISERVTPCFFLYRQGLSPCKIHQASLGAITVWRVFCEDSRTRWLASFALYYIHHIWLHFLHFASLNKKSLAFILLLEQAGHSKLKCSFADCVPKEMNMTSAGIP